ncbi:MAG: phosphorylcholine transferase LicD [Kiritimatiellia bacterium]
MREIKPEEHKRLEIDILKDIHRFCRENKITYFLAYGTLLGAIRHNGFIPWDIDDVDVAMPRPDYDRFLRLYSHDYFCAKNILIDNKYQAAITRVCDSRTSKLVPPNTYDYGVSIDVYPLDGVFNNRVFCWLHQFLLRFLVGIESLKILTSFADCMGDSWCRKHIYFKLLGYIIPRNVLARWRFMACKLAPYSSATFVCNYSTYHEITRRNKYPKSWFMKSVPVTFEGYVFDAPNGHDAWLRMYYGDYMTFPPESERTRHIKSAFWR